LVIQRDAAPCPITVRAISVYEDLAAQPSVLKRRLFSFHRIYTLLVLTRSNQALPKTPLGVLLVRIADSERKIKLTPRIFDVYVEISFGRSSILSTNLVLHRAQPQRNAVRPDYP